MDELGRDTFEEKNIHRLEKIEWDDLWFQEANNEEMKRVLFVGDSITRGMRPFINEMLAEENAVADQLATSKSVDNPFFLQLLDYAVAQQPKCGIIHILLGGHGGSLEISEYGKHYGKIIEYVTEKYRDKKIILASFTPLREREDLSKCTSGNERIVKRNEIAEKTAEKYNIPFADLYNVIDSAPDSEKLYTWDGVHLTDEGYKKLAEKSFSEIVKLIKK